MSTPGMHAEGAQGAQLPQPQVSAPVTRSKPSLAARWTTVKTDAADAAQQRPTMMSWRSALIIMTSLCAVLWVIQLINVADGYRLDQHGLRPRDLGGLVGIITSPFLHASFGHLIVNTFPFILIGWVVILSGVPRFVVASLIIIVVGGLATWLVAPSVGPHGGVVGASGLIMGWLGYLLGRAYFSRRILWIIAAVAVVFFFGGLFGGLLPSVNSDISWQGHVCGFAAGIFAAWLMHPRRDRRERRARDVRGGADPYPG